MTTDPTPAGPAGPSSAADQKSSAEPEHEEDRSIPPPGGFGLGPDTVLVVPPSLGKPAARQVPRPASVPSIAADDETVEPGPEHREVRFPPAVVPDMPRRRRPVAVPALAAAATAVVAAVVAVSWPSPGHVGVQTGVGRTGAPATTAPATTTPAAGSATTNALVPQTSPSPSTTRSSQKKTHAAAPRASATHHAPTTRKTSKPTATKTVKKCWIKDNGVVIGWIPC